MSNLFPYRNKIRLETMSDVNTFVGIVSQIETPIYLEDGKDFRVSAKSIIGAIASLEWDNLICVSADDIYSKISKFVEGSSLT